MIYKEFRGLKISALGMGCMRLPTVDGKEDQIDEAKTAEMVALAIEKGINYFDTAWPYHGGNSETVMGKVLEKYPRDSFYLTSKFPGFSEKNMRKMEEIFPTQLKKCRVDYFDFYLLHSVTEKNIDFYLDPKYGMREFILAQKAAGRIKHLGFSCHGDLDILKRFLDAYKGDMEFCQLQVNYVDWTFQQAKEKVELCAQYGLPVWVMEPVRGGRLADLLPAEAAALKALRPDESTAAWAFRYLQTLPNIGVVLSGMSNMAQLKDNLATFETEKPLNAQELSTLYEIAQGMIQRTALACTACHYCLERCPKGLDIPGLLSVYNRHAMTHRERAKLDLGDLPEDKRPSACIGCHSCESVCPQGLKIADAMAAMSR